MTQNEFDHLLESINVLSHEQMEQLRRELDIRLADSSPTADANEAMQRRLVEAGILSEVKPPITDLSVYRTRKAVPIQGEPISETAIRERR